MVVELVKDAENHSMRDVVGCNLTLDQDTNELS